MNAEPSLNEVNDFLKVTRNILNSDDHNFSIQTTRYEENPLDPFTTQNTLLALGFDDDDVIESLITLTAKDFSEKVPDFKRPGTPDFWVFEKIIDGRSIYVKFKIRDEKDKIIFCMSFHFARQPFTKKPYA
ncbi:type II toxin-antitoxin system MqsR family toxin [Solibacillus sp. FSL R7-0668]|uniref:type II toxin-antitoxin system MqsR family toxin n=1 Tax=Solibacillus sp. FSL R7-0668 TaxID=2921688 RepID=UPI0030FB75A6